MMLALAIRYYRTGETCPQDDGSLRERAFDSDALVVFAQDMVGLYFVALQIVNAVAAVGLYILLQRWWTARKVAATRLVAHHESNEPAEVQHRGDSAFETAGRLSQEAVRRKDSPVASRAGSLPDVFVPEPSMLELPCLPSDWAIRPEQIEIARRPNGTPWELGTGAFGKVVQAT